MSIEQLAETARAMVAPGKGIIAIDESTSTIAKRFAAVNVENTEENRRAYREMLLEGVLSIAEGENPRSIEMKLQGFMD